MRKIEIPASVAMLAAEGDCSFKRGEKELVKLIDSAQIMYKAFLFLYKKAPKICKLVSGKQLSFKFNKVNSLESLVEIKVDGDIKEKASILTDKLGIKFRKGKGYLIGSMPIPSGGKLTLSFEEKDSLLILRLENI